MRENNLVIPKNTKVKMFKSTQTGIKYSVAYYLYLFGLFLTAFCKRNYLGASVITILGFIIASSVVY
ncbi:hypothetical protein [Helicobacter turcicus]|nr:hypothetical protein [Helicobacter turcicus]MBX7546201.1 hypothetical protein [Helicobacter turcicus]